MAVTKIRKMSSWTLLIVSLISIVNYTWKKSVHSITATGVFSAQKYQYDRLYGASKDLSFN